MMKAHKEKAMGLMPLVRLENAAANISGNRVERLPFVLPKVQTRKHHQRKEFHD